MLIRLKMPVPQRQVFKSYLLLKTVVCLLFASLMSETWQCHSEGVHGLCMSLCLFCFLGRLDWSVLWFRRKCDHVSLVNLLFKLCFSNFPRLFWFVFSARFGAFSSPSPRIAKIEEIFQLIWVHKTSASKHEHDFARPWQMLNSAFLVWFSRVCMTRCWPFCWTSSQR